jgi:hypothetical protein
MGVNQMRTPNIAMIAAAQGLMRSYIDLEHNPTSLETAAAIGVAASASASRRSCGELRDAHDATRSSIAGRKVSWSRMSAPSPRREQWSRRRYPPQGHRSASGSGPALGYAARSQGDQQFLSTSRPR